VTATGLLVTVLKIEEAAAREGDQMLSVAERVEDPRSLRAEVRLELVAGRRAQN
jgi:hypothetical protein